MTDVLLSGENRASALSLEPGKGYGGYVAWKETKGQTIVRSLSDLSREAIVSEAGHRAVFLLKKFGSGGGSGSLDEKLNERRDDFAHVTHKIDAMISNNQIDGLSEFSSKEEIQAFKKFAHNLFAFAADYLITTGKESKAFQGIYDRALAKRYLNEAELDEAVKGIEKQLPSKNLIFAKSLRYGVIQSRRALSAGQKPLSEPMVKGLVGRIFVELISKTNEAEIAELKAIQKKMLLDIDLDCSHELHSK